MIELIIPATHGRIGWKHVAASLAKALQLDQTSIAELLPAGEIKLDSPAVSLSLLAINLAVGDRMSFAVTDSEDQPPGLLIRCDPSLLRRENPNAPASQVVIHHDEDWRATVDGRPLVLCLHGLNGTYETFDGLRQNLRSCGYRTAAISYEPQRPIAVLAREISKEVTTWLDSVSHKHGLVLVGHSMGGLIAREWTNNSALENDAIIGLVTIGTPHQGSAWATLPPLMNLFAKDDFGVGDLKDVILHTPSSPELRDIAPESAFLRQLNARDNRPNVQYTSVIGVGSPVDSRTVARIQHAFRQLEQRDGFVRLIRPRIEPLLNGFDELIDGQGDGIVSAESAAMASTSDLVRVDLSHFELVRPLSAQSVSDEAGHPVWRIVIDRVNRCCPVVDGDQGMGFEE